MGFFRDFLKIPKIQDFLSLGIFILGIRDFLSLGIFISGIRDFSKSQDFNPRDSGFFLISGFLSRDFCEIPEIRDFYLRHIPGIVILGSGFFSWDGIYRKKATSDDRGLLNHNVIFSTMTFFPD